MIKDFWEHLKNKFPVDGWSFYGAICTISIGVSRRSEVLPKNLLARNAKKSDLTFGDI